MASGYVDRSAALPLYHQLKEILISEMRRNLTDGDRLPSEAELCARFHVSRTVVRQTLDELEREGVVYRIKGKGTYAVSRKLESNHIQSVVGFHAAMTRLGHRVSNRVLYQALEPATGRVSQQLGLHVGQPVVCIGRVRMVDDEPISVVRSWLPTDLCPGLEKVDLSDASLYSVIGSEYGLSPHHGRRSIEAIAISDEDAALLGVAPGSPALYSESLVSTERDRPLEYFVAVYRGDRSRLDIELVGSL